MQRRNEEQWWGFKDEYGEEVKEEEAIEGVWL